MGKIKVSLVMGIWLLILAGYGHADTACSIVIESDLSFMLPSVTIDSTSISVNFEYAGEENGKLLWKLKDTDEEKVSVCPTTLNADLSFDLPNVLYELGFVSVSFEYIGEQNGAYLWTLKTIGEGATPYPPDTYTNSLGMTFNRITADVFMMGSPDDELERGSTEVLRQVTLTEDYFMQTTEVTQEQWLAVMDVNPSANSSCGGDCPVETVSWETIQVFIESLNLLGEGSYALPTEAQWEYACRGGSSLAFTNGKFDNFSNLDSIAWHYENANYTTHPVAQKLSNAFGLYDMHGNVMEWCHDWWSVPDEGPATDPSVGPLADEDKHVIKGGSAQENLNNQRSAVRGNFLKTTDHPWIGFRLVAIPPVQDITPP